MYETHEYVSKCGLTAKPFWQNRSRTYPSSIPGSTPRSTPCGSFVLFKMSCAVWTRISLHDITSAPCTRHTRRKHVPCYVSNMYMTRVQHVWGLLSRACVLCMREPWGVSVYTCAHKLTPRHSYVRWETHECVSKRCPISKPFWRHLVI